MNLQEPEDRDNTVTISGRRFEEAPSWKSCVRLAPIGATKTCVLVDREKRLVKGLDRTIP